ncbi:hypothetical protein FB567DRAFT_596772 [Paraphoma chrysanthemicola]|uniref:Uncharacterized protein n=1 Tax=Paraphoma chrysanthemicola TaxID=798071 RepID=A0A8K0QZA2_9PLEO|nr:hypothetical protein FB567DRAFT_596772 [Paraphoma chrysanthemicola]
MAKLSRTRPPIPRAYERESQPWVLPNKLTKLICLCAGREASAALCIALSIGKHNGASAARQATFFEPFNYWDWHGIAPDDDCAREVKKQRFWEYERGFMVNGTIPYGYPTSEERWKAFTSILEKHPERRHWVKRIAIAHWMTTKHLTWITENLVALEGLDLSDIPELGNQPELISGQWPDLIDEKIFRRGVKINNLLATLSWLGLPDFRDVNGHVALGIMERVLPRCIKLATLSIRSRHNGQIKPEFTDCHAAICDLPSRLVLHAPPSVQRLELRLVYPNIGYLIDTLEARKSSIKSIGIDLGAWIQAHNQEEPDADQLDEAAIKSAAHLVAQRFKLEVYRMNYSKFLHEDQERSSLETDVAPPKPYAGGVRHTFEQDFFRDDGTFPPLDTSSHCQVPHVSAVDCRWHDEPLHHGQILQFFDRGADATLTDVLVNMFHAASKRTDFKLFALQPEWQYQSENPIHPYALLQQLDEGDSSVAKVRDMSSPEVYQWLNQTFHWRPVFDWDWFVTPDHRNHDGNLHPAYKNLRMDWPRPPPTEGFHDDLLIIAIQKQFKLLDSAGIPVHILIGRRHPDGPSLYWGWPYDTEAWAKWLDAPLDASLRIIAPLISTLTVSYDLRSPLDEDRLREMDELCGSLNEDEELARHTKLKKCVRPVCPWAAIGNECPFCGELEPSLQKETKEKLSNNLPGNPPVGVYAADHRPDSDDTDADHEAGSNIHKLARDAAYKREAIGWNRFWNEYADSMTTLKELRVRMPRCFDTTGSVRLARLLKSEKGWRRTSYANERQDLQSNINAENYYRNGESTCTRTPEAKRWPAGSFVRRTWVRRDPPAISSGKITELHRNEDDAEGLHEPNSTPHGGQIFEEEVEARTTRREAEELENAVNKAEVAALLEQELEEKLRRQMTAPVRAATPVNTAPDFENDEVESRFRGRYGRRIRRIAQTEWHTSMEAYIDEFEQLADKAAILYKMFRATRKSGEEPGAKETDAENARDLLTSTVKSLRHRNARFRAADVFRVKGQDEAFRDGLGLVVQETDLAAEEWRHRTPCKQADGADVEAGQAPDIATTEAPDGHVVQSVDVEQTNQVNNVRVETTNGAGNIQTTSVQITIEIEDVEIEETNVSPASPFDSLFEGSPTPKEPMQTSDQIAIAPIRPSSRPEGAAPEPGTTKTSVSPKTVRPTAGPPRTPASKRVPSPTPKTSSPLRPPQTPPQASSSTHSESPKSSIKDLKSESTKPPAKARRAVRNTRDPVIDLSTLNKSGRELRSRSGTPKAPKPKYVEEKSDDEDEGDEEVKDEVEKAKVEMGGKEGKKSAKKVAKGTNKKKLKEEDDSGEEYVPEVGKKGRGKGRGGKTVAAKGRGKKRGPDEDDDGKVKVTKKAKI